MAEIWFCFAGPEPTRGGPDYELPIDECMLKLALSENTFLSDLATAPKFQDASGLGQLGGYRRAVVRLENNEANFVGWKPGYYVIPLDPKEVIARLGTPSID